MTDRTDELFLQIIELDPADRAGVLDSECGGDDNLRARVASMLELAEHDLSSPLQSTTRILVFDIHTG